VLGGCFGFFAQERGGWKAKRARGHLCGSWVQKRPHARPALHKGEDLEDTVVTCEMARKREPIQRSALASAKKRTFLKNEKEWVRASSNHPEKKGTREGGVPQILIRKRGGAGGFV